MRHNIINTNSIEKLIEAIDDNILNNFTPTLAFIYSSVHYDIPTLVQKLKKYKFFVVGASTVGEIYADSYNGTEVKDKTITCMLVELDKSAFALKVKDVNKKDNYYKLGTKMAKWSRKKFSNPAILTITSGLYFDNDTYLKGLQTKVNYLFGAAAGDDNVFQNTYAFSQEKITLSGALVLAIDRDKIDIVSSRGFGWSGIGTQRVVTKSIKNIVYTIDDKPAVNFYKEYLNITQDDMPGMGVDYPLEVQLANGQIVYRAAVHINQEDGSLVFSGHVEEDSKVRISAPIGEQIIEHVEESILKSLTGKEDFKSDLTLIFPCAAHKNLLGSYGKKEIEAVYNATQNAPLIGFYAYGEIASSQQNNAFHNETFVTVQLREKK